MEPLCQSEMADAPRCQSRAKRYFTPIALGATLLSAAALLSPAARPPSSAIALAADEQAAQPTSRAHNHHRTWSEEGTEYGDDYAYSYLYDCKNGRPSVPEAYKNGSWGTIYGDWYVIAGNIEESSDASGDCCRMRFNYANGGMNQNMMYTRGDEEYFWNYTGNVEYKSQTGRWINEDGDGTNTDMYSGFWSGVILVGTYKDVRWWSWYFCGPAVTVTKDGIPWVLAEDYSLYFDDDFASHVEAKLDELGALDYGTYTTYDQGDSCDYTWHHVGVDVE